MNKPASHFQGLILPFRFGKHQNASRKDRTKCGCKVGSGHGGVYVLALARLHLSRKLLHSGEDARPHTFRVAVDKVLTSVFLICIME